MSDLERTAALDHVPRPMIPWRTNERALTECGQPVDGTQTIDLDALVSRFRKLGQRRAALTVCMTCLQCVTWGDRLRPIATWDTNPRDVMERELQRVTRGRSEQAKADRDLLDRELTAIALLVDAYREQFDGLVTGQAETVDLTARRRARASGERWLS